MERKHGREESKEVHKEGRVRSNCVEGKQTRKRKEEDKEAWKKEYKKGKGKKGAEMEENERKAPRGYYREGMDVSKEEEKTASGGEEGKE